MTIINTVYPKNNTMTVVKTKKHGRCVSGNNTGVVRPGDAPREEQLLSPEEIKERMRIEKSHDPKAHMGAESRADRFRRRFSLR